MRALPKLALSLILCGPALFAQTKPAPSEANGYDGITIHQMIQLSQERGNGDVDRQLAVEEHILLLVWRRVTAEGAEYLEKKQYATPEIQLAARRRAWQIRYRSDHIDELEMLKHVTAAQIEQLHTKDSPLVSDSLRGYLLDSLQTAPKPPF